MITSNKLTAERIAEIEKIPITYDDDSPKFTKEELLDVINSLPEGYKMVFNLYAVEGFKHREIAEMLGIDINTSKSQFMRARGVIIKKLNELKKFKMSEL